MLDVRILPRLQADMADPIKRRKEILKEITELGKLQKEAVEDATFMRRTTSGDGAYEERARRISRLASELVSLGLSKTAEGDSA